MARVSSVASNSPESASISRAYSLIVSSISRRSSSPPRSLCCSKLLSSRDATRSMAGSERSFTCGESSIHRDSPQVKDLSLPAMDLVASLLDKSLLQQSDRGGDELRLLMLETIREY